MRIRLVAAGLAVVCLAGCSKPASSTSSAPKSIGDLHLATPSTSDRAAYLFGLKSTSGFTLTNAGITDDNLVLLGESICKLFDNGSSLSDIASRTLAAAKTVGGTPDDAVDLTSAAVVNLCPAYVSKIS